MTEKGKPTTEPKKPPPKPLPPLRRLGEADKAAVPGERVTGAKQGTTTQGKKG